MNLPIIYNILHGMLRPNICNMKFMELESTFEKLPNELDKLERLFISAFPDIKFDFDSERPFCLNDLSPQDYTTLDDDKIFTNLELPLPEPTSPKESFYQSVVRAESLRIKLAITDFSIKQKSDIDTRHEIRATLTNILKHIKYIGNDCDAIYSTLKTQLICLYIELTQIAYNLLLQNDDYYSFKNLMYEVSERYPNKEELEIYQMFVEKCQEGNNILENIEEYEEELPVTQSDKFIKTVNNYYFFELEMVKSLSKSKQKKLIRLIVEKSVAYSIAMLKYIGYFDRLQRVYKLSKEQSFEHISKAIGTPKRNVKGNFNVLNPNSKENVLTYNSHLYINEVEKDYKNL